MEVQLSQIEIAKAETAGVTSRLSTLQTQFYQMKAQWAAEKSEMESRVFQALSLQQSTLGTMRKKENDFDKLQSQLAKMLKDSQKAQKNSIFISKPLPRQWNTTEAPLLRDAEIIALQSSISAANVIYLYLIAIETA
jgi:hypothetical protein